MLNHIVLMGRLVRDPELRRTQSGIAVTSFRIAVDRDFQSRESGERQTDFIDIVAWRNTAEFAAKYFQKGRMVVVSGRLQMRDWTDRDNNKRTTAEVVADNLYFGDSKRDGDTTGGYTPAARPAQDGFSGGYAGNNSYSGGYSGNNNYSGNNYPGSYSEPVAPSGFSELSEEDGDLPF